MSWYLTPEHRELRERLRDFAERTIGPIAAAIDEEDRFPEEIVPALAREHILGMAIPEEYGGGGKDTISYCIAVEEIGRVSGSIGLTVAAHNSLVCHLLCDHASEAQKRKYLVPLARGEALGAFALTEPHAGSDAGSTQTRAQRQGDRYIVNGSKLYITNGSVARTVVLTARTSGQAGTHGISALIAQASTPGFLVAVKEKKMGLRGSDTVQLSFEDMSLPAENLIGEEGHGFKIFLKTLDGGRISIGALALGLAQAALDTAVAYSETRMAFGRPISSQQSIQQMIATMATEVEAARHLVYSAAILKDKHLPYGRESAMAKLYASEVSMRATTNAIQIHGPHGYLRDDPVQRFYRDAKLMEIGEGTSEIQRLVIARHYLKKGFEMRTEAVSK